MAQSYDDEKYRRFELLQAERHQEQAHFWNRFTAFATLHADIFVIATSTNVQSQRIASLGVAIAGLGLSGLWAEVQRLSLRYVDRWKPIYHRERRFGPWLPGRAVESAGVVDGPSKCGALGGFLCLGHCFYSNGDIPEVGVLWHATD